MDSQLISPDNSEEFLPGGDSRLEAFLTGIKNNSMNESGTSNPRYEVDSPPSDFNFDTMLPGRGFTMAGEEYIYLENQGSGNHMIIRHATIPNTMPQDQDQVFTEWFSSLDAEVRAMVQPVDIPAPAPAVDDALITFIGAAGTDRWIPDNLTDFPAAAGDVTSVNPSGTPQAFSLSLADVTRFSTPEGPFPNYRERNGKGWTSQPGAGWWWMRTPGVPSTARWNVQGSIILGTTLFGLMPNHPSNLRPAIIIHQ